MAVTELTATIVSKIVSLWDVVQRFGRVMECFMMDDDHLMVGKFMVDLFRWMDAGSSQLSLISATERSTRGVQYDVGGRQRCSL